MTTVIVTAGALASILGSLPTQDSHGPIRPMSLGLAGCGASMVLGAFVGGLLS